MPCTLEPWEIEIEEKNFNMKEFGMAATDERLLEYVACQACRMLRAHGFDERMMEAWSPILAKWWAWHQEQDRQRLED